MAETQPPPSGWESPRDDPSDLDALGQVLRTMLEVVPTELQTRFIEAIRSLLEAIRALIEWWVDRLEGRGRSGPEPEVRDIPIS